MTVPVETDARNIGPTGLAIMPREHLQAQLEAMGITWPRWTGLPVAVQAQALASIATAMAAQRSMVTSMTLVQRPTDTPT